MKIPNCSLPRIPFPSGENGAGEMPRCRFVHPRGWILRVFSPSFGSTKTYEEIPLLLKRT